MRYINPRFTYLLTYLLTGTRYQQAYVSSQTHSQMDAQPEYILPAVPSAGRTDARKRSRLHEFNRQHGRPHTGQIGSADHPGKMDEKLKSENMQNKSSFLCLCFASAGPYASLHLAPAPHHSVFYRPDALPAAQPTASKH